MKSQFMIAAPMSGSGKTTIARGLMALFNAKGLRVQPFKCGPDYIDTKFHAAVCGRPSVNLDTFMAQPTHVRSVFGRYSSGSDVCVVEGMMGLFDGYDRDKGSSSEIARVLNLPVVLVVDARSAAYSMAPLLSGFIGFNKDVRIVGVIFNKVGSLRHADMLRQVCSDLHVTCFGCVPKSKSLEQGSRYLGLDFSESASKDELVGLLEQHVDYAGILNISASETHASPLTLAPSRDKTILIARNDEAFSFVYQEVIDSFRNVKFFNPEADVPSLESVDLLYLPGGYPEKHAKQLEKATATRMAIRSFAKQGGCVIAECGGMMYLCRQILTDEGNCDMCGVLPYSVSARKQDRKLSLGYRRFEYGGKEFRGHEFHYTQFVVNTPKSAIQVFDARGNEVPTPVFRHGNVIASYTHLYNVAAMFDELTLSKSRK